ARTQHHANTLVQRGGLDIQNALFAVDGQSPGLLDDEAHGVRFVHQSQFAGLAAGALVAGVHEYAAAAVDPMHIGDHRGNPAHVVVLFEGTFLAGQTFVDVASHGHFPMAHVRHVDRELLRLLRNSDVVVGEAPGTGFTVKRESHDTIANREHQHGLRAVDRVAGRYLPAAGLQEVLLFHLAARCLGWRLQYRENGTDRDVYIDVGGTVEGIEQQEVFALGVAIRN